jgi:hypothetical protein
MKELLTSFLSSTVSNVNREKSITHDHDRKVYSHFICSILLVSAFFLSSINSSFAQANVPGTASVSTVVAESTISQWKSPVEYAAVITAMKSSTMKILGDPNTSPADHVLYTGLDRLLSYIQSDLEAHADVTKIAEKNYNQVVLEAPSDPALSNMDMSQFAILYTSLADKLHQ